MDRLSFSLTVRIKLNLTKTDAEVDFACTAPLLGAQSRFLMPTAPSENELEIYDNDPDFMMTIARRKTKYLNPEEAAGIYEERTQADIQTQIEGLAHTF